MQCWTLSIWFKIQYCISIKPKCNEIFAIAEDIYTFDNFIPHILDIKIHPDGLSIYFKDTNTWQYTRYNNLFPLHNKISWIYTGVANISDKSKLIYVQGQKSMPWVIEKVPFRTILTIVVITAILKIYSFSILIHLIKYYLVWTQ